jgi:CBS domain-containing protein
MLADKKVSEIMTPAPLDSVESILSVMDAAKIMKNKKRSSVVVLKDGKAVGIITERDFVRRVLAENANAGTTKIYSVMSSPIISVSPEATVGDVAKLLKERGIGRTLIMRKDLIIGIVTARDIIRAFVTESPKDLQFFKAVLRSMEPSWQ